MASIVAAVGILEKIADGRLAEPIVTAPASIAPGGLSVLAKHRRLQDAEHVATTHRIWDAAGRTVHRHGKDILIGELKFVLVKEPQP